MKCDFYNNHSWINLRLILLLGTQLWNWITIAHWRTRTLFSSSDVWQSELNKKKTCYANAMHISLFFTSVSSEMFVVFLQRAQRACHIARSWQSQTPSCEQYLTGMSHPLNRLAHLWKTFGVRPVCVCPLRLLSLLCLLVRQMAK